MSERLYKFIQKHKTKCPCFICRATMRIIDFWVKAEIYYNSLRYHRKWRNVEYWGSDYPDFREYEVISKKKVRMDGKGIKWPKTTFKHIRMVDLAVEQRK